jgi:hypothetical protein
MIKRFGRKTRETELEALLRSARPRPSRELTDMLTTYVARAPARSGRGFPARLAVAVVLSAAMLSAVTALVGVGYAASAPQAAVAAVVAAVTAPVSSAPAAAPAPAVTASSQSQEGNEEDDDDEPAKDQYKPGKGCGDKNHVHAKENECKKPPK